MNDYEELGTIYESRVLNEGAIQNLGVIIKDGLSKGLDIFDIIRTHLQEFISIMAIVSSFGLAREPPPTRSASALDRPISHQY